MKFLSKDTSVKTNVKLIITMLLVIGFIVLLGECFKVVLKHSEIYISYSLEKAILLNCLFIIWIFITFQNIKSYDLCFSRFFKILIATTMVMYVVVLIFVISANILSNYNIYFNGLFISLVLKVNWIYSLLVIYILFNIIRKIKNQDIIYKNKMSKVINKISSILTEIILIGAFIYITYFGGINTLLSSPYEKEVFYRDTKYIIKVDYVFRPSNEYPHLYHEVLNFLLVKRLSEGEIPEEILSDGNYNTNN